MQREQAMQPIYSIAHWSYDKIGIMCRPLEAGSHQAYPDLGVRLGLLVGVALFGLMRASPVLHMSFGFVRVQPIFVSFVLFLLIIRPLIMVHPRSTDVDTTNGLRVSRYGRPRYKFAVSVKLVSGTSLVLYQR